MDERAIGLSAAADVEDDAVWVAELGGEVAPNGAGLEIEKAAEAGGESGERRRGWGEEGRAPMLGLAEGHVVPSAEGVRGVGHERRNIAYPGKGSRWTRRASPPAKTILQHTLGGETV
jgi:hypothetical protein